MNFIKKAAMFGLDARIALAIFGALSVISGAALYSAIQTAQIESYWQGCQEIIKASEQYYLDNGKQLPIFGLSNSLYSSDLLENRENLNTWRGPYISGTKKYTYSITNGVTEYFSKNSWLNIALSEISTWATTSEPCVAGSVDCAEWLIFNTVESDYSKAKNLFELLDNIKDNEDGLKAGNVRMQDTGSIVYIYIKGISHKKM